MANEFIARKGLIVPSGSITVSSGSVTATNFIGTASVAISSSFATTASFALNAAGSGFPFTGNAVITGSLNVTQAVTASYFKGDGSQLTNLSVVAGQSALRIDTYQFDGDGTTTQYTLSESIYQVDDLIVSVGGVSYSPTLDYTFSTSVLTFTEAPPSASNIIIRGFVAVTSGSVNTLSGSFTGSLYGTSSWAQNAISSSYATTASFASNVLKTKAGSIAYTSFAGLPYSASVIFNTAFSNTNYAVVVTGEDARSWTIESKTAGGFTVSTNSNTALTGTTYWNCTTYGEN